MLRTLSSFVMLLVLAPASLAQDDDTALPDLQTIMEQVTEIRGLPFTEDVPAEEQSMEDFQKMMMEEIEKEYGDGEEFNDIVDGLMRLGLLKKRIQLDEAFVNAFASQAGAYYDPETGKFFYLY